MPPRRLPLATLNAFETAARLGSFRTAAEELHVTPAAVSHRIKALEAELGVRLFERRARGVTLTRAGERYRERLAEAFTLIEQATAELGRPPIDGPLRVSAPQSFTRHCLLPRLGDLLQRHPGLRLDLLGADHLVDLHRGEADLAIRFGGGHYPGLQTDYLLGDAITALGPAEAATGDWRRQRFIEDGGATATEPWSHWSPWWHAEGLHATSDLARLRVSDAGLALAACRQGLGLCLTRFTLARQTLRQGTLKPLRPWRRTEFAYYLVGLPGVLASPRAAAFRDWLRNSLAPLEQELQAALAGSSGQPPQRPE
ncbi:LysR substrate-binding domain-containing protein [Halomonas sp. 328]|uniref:LysR substrate-binding domain-containing protein n=1 Tax=Halomonas sp. 328 TaxID=2776704 RepID=UPI0018A7DDD1|nr:LysR substrate-binding domain-containing protein [Halomonas sp. 328]MBF8221904.1 LysR family transcriptional regulator [Halomonas sp. 328]